MKVNSKKIISLLLIVLMLTAFVTSCNSGQSNNSNVNDEAAEDSGIEKTEDGIEKEDDTESSTDSSLGEIPKVGIIIWGTTDALGRNSTMMVQKMVEQVGGEVVIDTSATSPETQIQSAENLIAAGCNGLLIVNYSDQMLPRLGQICKDNEVYWGLTWRRLISDEVVTALEENEYFVGFTAEDEIEISERLATALADNGAKEVAVVSSNVGDTTHDMRNEGFDNICAKTEMERVAEYRGGRSAPEVMEAVEKFLTGYPNLDAIFMTGGTNSQLEGALSALDKHNKRGEIPIAVIDFIDADLMEEYLEDGTLFRIAGGHYVDPIFTASLVINAIQGNPLSDQYEEITLKFIDFEKSSDAIDYYKYVENDNEGIYAYTEEELGNMLKSINPEFTIEELKQIALNYSVEDVMDRHGVE